VGDDWTAPVCIPKLLARTGAAEFFEIVFPLSTDRAASRYDRDLAVPCHLMRGGPSRTMKHYQCYYYKCDRPGVIFIGLNGGDSHWICFFHYTKWNADRARFLAQGLPCEMEELGELFCDKRFNRVL
jgi:hypothetical protein